MKNAFFTALACGVVSTLIYTAAFAQSASYRLNPPFDVDSIRLKTGKVDHKPFTCQKPPAPMVDIQVESFYDKKEGTYSVVDPKAYAAYKKATKPASKFEIGLAKMANRYVRSNPARPDLAVCDLEWLHTWADAGALLGNVNKNGEYTRKWLLGSISSVWLQIRDEPALDPAKRKKVTEWIRAVANAARADYSRDTHLNSRQNNHLYWAAWGVGAAGMALDDTDMFDWAISKARIGIDSIEEDGTLPLELGRGQKAYLYHLFSALPLFMLANAAEKNGINLFSQNDNGLQRLGKLSLANLGDPDFFEEASGREQDLTRVGTSSDLGWVEIYRKHYQDPRADAALKTFRPMKHSRFGGNITLLYSELLVPSPKKAETRKK